MCSNTKFDYNSFEGSVNINGVDLSSPSSGASNPTATWKGFLVSESKSRVSKLTVAGIFLVGGICTGVGIELRNPAIYFAFPIITALAEAFYLGGRAYHYFKPRHHDIETVEELIDDANKDTFPVKKAIRETSEYVSQEGVYLLGQKEFCQSQDVDDSDPVALMPYFEMLWKHSVSIKSYDFVQQEGLLKSLKRTFPDYFLTHSHLQKQSLFQDDDQCKATFEGICKHYNLTLVRANAFSHASVSEEFISEDNGDCLYDSVWQFISDDKKRELHDQFYSVLNNEEWSCSKQRPDYDVLKVALLKTLEDDEVLKLLVMTNNQDPQSPKYSSFSEYRSLIINGGTFWGRHNVEGVVLAKALGINIVLTGGSEFDYRMGFFEREDAAVNEINEQLPTIYIGNRHHHYYPVRKVDNTLGGC